MKTIIETKDPQTREALEFLDRVWTALYETYGLGNENIIRARFIICDAYRRVQLNID